MHTTLNTNLRVRWGFILLLTCFNLKSQTFQNLVPNPSFETYTQCPNLGGELDYATPWYGSNCASSDYFNSCDTTFNVPHYGGINQSYPYYLNAKHGNAYAGIHLFQQGNFREYATVALIDTLKNGYCYYVEFYAATSQWVKYYANNISANLSTSNSFPSTGCILNLTPHITNYGNPVIMDTVKWTKISGLYKANGNERYLTIGNFKNDSNTDTINVYLPGQTPYYTWPDTYIFIDAVSVYSINPNGNLPWKYSDTTIVLGDSVYIGNSLGGTYNPSWYTIGGNFIAQNAGIYVKPTVTNSYVVQYTVCGVSRQDTVKVTVITDSSIESKESELDNVKVYPNPAEDKIILEYAKGSLNKFSEIKVVDVLGRMVISIPLDDNKQIIDVSRLNNGCYFIIFTTNDNISFYRKMIKN